MVKIAANLIKQAANIAANIADISKGLKDVKMPTQLASGAGGLGNLPKTMDAMGQFGLKEYNFGGKTFKFNPDFGDRLMGIDAAMKRDGLKGLQINSGYRTAAEQDAIMNRMGGRPIPGIVTDGQHSVHGTGFAADIGNWQDAQRYAPQYGLQNKLPNDRVHFTPSANNESYYINQFKSMYGGKLW